MKANYLKATLLSFVLTIVGCQSTTYPLLKIVDNVDLARFMGDWYVIANIPTFIEKGAHNAVETYQLEKDGSIDTTFTYYAGSFTGEKKRYHARGFVLDHESNAVWGMQFIWPIKADYRIIYLTPDYSQTVIAREARDYVWIMARSPSIPETDFQKILVLLEEQGYNTNQIQKVPQRWPVPSVEPNG